MRVIACVALSLCPVVAVAAGIGGTPPPWTGTSSTAVEAPRFDVTDVDWAYYVDPAGSDTNDGSASSPFATIEKAIESVPDRWRGSARIYVTGDDYAISGEYRARIGSPEGPDGEPLVIQGVTADSGLGTRTITGTTLWNSTYVYEIEDSSLSPTADQYQGYWVRITSGSAEGVRRIIVGNSTGGNFELNLGVLSPSTHPQIGDTFVVERPATRIQMDNHLMFTASGRGKASRYFNVDGGVNLILRDVWFQGQDSSSYLDFSGIGVVAQGVLVTGPPNDQLIVHDRAHLGAGVYAPTLTADGLTDDYDRVGDGVYVEWTSYNGYGVYAEDFSTITGSWALVNSKFWGRLHAMLSLRSLYMEGGKMEAETQTNVTLENVTYGPTHKILSSPNYGIQFVGSTGIEINDLVIDGAVDDALHISDSSYAYIDSITGTGSGGCGLQTSHRGHVRVGSGVTVTGSGGDICAGDSVIDYTTFGTVDYFTDTEGGAATKL